MKRLRRYWQISAHLPGRSDIAYKMKITDVGIYKTYLDKGWIDPLETAPPWARTVWYWEEKEIKVPAGWTFREVEGRPEYVQLFVSGKPGVLFPKEPLGGWND